MKLKDYDGTYGEGIKKFKTRKYYCDDHIGFIVTVEVPVAFGHTRIDFKAQGTARCQRTDEFNHDFAFDLAYTRATKKIYDKIENYLIKYEATKAAEAKQMEPVFDFVRASDAFIEGFKLGSTQTVDLIRDKFNQ
jgi:hypothetical protein